MIVDDTMKTIILGVPKTGSTTVLEIFGGGDVADGRLRHAKYDYYANKPEYKDYKYFGFFREPVDRFYGTLQYMKQRYKEEYKDRGNWQYEKGMDALGLTDLDQINAATVMDALEAGAKGPVLDLFEHQTLWLNDNVNLLSFYYFEDDVRYLAKFLNRPIPENIPKLNASKVEYASPIKEVDERRIRNFYKRDYEFLGWQGVL